MKYLNYIVITALILLGLFISQCPTPTPIIKTTSDTNIVYSTDTVRIYDTTTKYIKVFINKPIPIYFPVDSNPNDSILVNKYENTFEDSILLGNTNIIVEGKLLENSFNYKLKIPLQVRITDSIFTTINTTHTVQDKRLHILLGAESGGNLTSFDFKLIGGIHTKDNWNFFYNYGLLSKSHNVGIMKSIPLGK